MNRATEGDLVVLRLLPEAQWKASAESRVADHVADRADEEATDELGASEGDGAKPFAADFDTAVEQARV